MGRITTCLCVVALAASAIAADGDKITWHTRAESGLRKVTLDPPAPKGGGKKLLVIATSSNCVYCDKLDAETFKNADVIKLVNERFVAVKMPAKDNFRYLSDHRITRFPTIIVAEPDGFLAMQYVGYLDAAALTTLLKACTEPSK